MNTLPDLSQLTHEQLLEFTRQLAMQHQSLAQSNQQLDAKVQHLEACNQHLSILNQKYEHELALFKQHCMFFVFSQEMRWMSGDL